MFLRKYGTGSGSDVIIPMVKRGVVDFAVTADWTPASGDVKVSKDGGTEANIGTLPVINGTVGWKFVFSDSELQCKSLTVRVVDSATKAVEDQFFVIETYGHASAMFVVDFSTAAFGANTTAPATPTNVTDAQTAILAKLPESGRAATPADVSPTINFSPTIEPTELSAGSVSAIQSGLALESSVQSVITTLSEGVELDSATLAQLDAIEDNTDASVGYLTTLVSRVTSTVKTMWDALTEMISGTTPNRQFTAKALELAPAGGSGGGPGDATLANQELILARLSEVTISVTGYAQLDPRGVLQLKRGHTATLTFTSDTNNIVSDLSASTTKVFFGVKDAAGRSWLSIEGTKLVNTGLQSVQFAVSAADAAAMINGEHFFDVVAVYGYDANTTPKYTSLEPFTSGRAKVTDLYVNI